MVFPVYTNFVAPAIDAGNLNEVNNVVYNMLGTGGNPPLSTLEIRNNTGVTAADAATLASANATSAAGDATTLASATALPGRLLNVQTLTVSGNYTPTAGTTRIVAVLLGGGGGGGGAAANGPGVSSTGAGGGAGALSIHYATSGFSGQPFVIGAGGTAGAGVAGGAGGNTTFLGVTAPGGTGGTLGPSVGAPTFTAAFQGSAGTGANIVNGAAPSGEKGLLLSVSGYLVGGMGASSAYGSGGVGGTTVVGAPGLGKGAGGGGAGQVASAAALSGGVGSPGMIIVYEYN